MKPIAFVMLLVQWPLFERRIIGRCQGVAHSAKATALCCVAFGWTLAVDSAYADEGEVPLTVATVCMNAKTDTATNLETFAAYISEASEKGAKLIVFPEIALQQNPGWGFSSYQPTEEELRDHHRLI